MIDEEVASMIQTVGAETLRLCKNEELQKRLEHEAKLNAMQDVAEELVESVTRYDYILRFCICRLFDLTVKKYFKWSSINDVTLYSI